MVHAQGVPDVQAAKKSNPEKMFVGGHNRVQGSTNQWFTSSRRRGCGKCRPRGYTFSISPNIYVSGIRNGDTGLNEAIYRFLCCSKLLRRSGRPSIHATQSGVEWRFDDMKDP